MSDLRTAASDCADELEAAVNERYSAPNIHPAYVRKYERDMEPVRAVRQALIADSAQHIQAIGAALSTPPDALQRFVDSQKPLAPEDRPTSQQLWEMYDSAPADARPEQEETTLAVEVRRAVNAALSVITKLNGGELQWTIGIPARPSDPDIIIGVALNAACRAADALSRPATQQNTMQRACEECDHPLYDSGRCMVSFIEPHNCTCAVCASRPATQQEGTPTENAALAKQLGDAAMHWTMSGEPDVIVVGGKPLSVAALLARAHAALSFPLPSDEKIRAALIDMQNDGVRATIVRLCSLFASRPATASEPTK